MCVVAIRQNVDANNNEMNEQTNAISADIQQWVKYESTTAKNERQIIK